MPAFHSKQEYKHKFVVVFIGRTLPKNNLNKIYESAKIVVVVVAAAHKSQFINSPNKSFSDHGERIENERGKLNDISRVLIQNCSLHCVLCISKLHNSVLLIKSQIEYTLLRIYVHISIIPTQKCL